MGKVLRKPETERWKTPDTKLVVEFAFTFHPSEYGENTCKNIHSSTLWQIAIYFKMSIFATSNWPVRIFSAVKINSGAVGCLQ